MLTITFKNVGHGDTIILEWKNDKGNDEIGIIDCNLNSVRQNPVIEHIKSHKYTRINFMILTHPHTDHFSGFPTLLEYCKDKGIEIENFWHTAAFNKTFLEEFLNKRINLNDAVDSFVGRKKDRKNLKKFFREIHNLDGTTTLKEGGIANNTSKLILNENENLRLECLSPSNRELEQYCRETFSLDSEGELEIRRRENNPEADLLCSFIKISAKDWYILFPSDSKKSTLKRIMNNYQDRLNNNRLSISQIPHHGSAHSHVKQIWLKIPGRESVPVFISVGSKYRLPSEEVIKFYDEKFKEIHSTNYVGGYKSYFDKKNKAILIEQSREAAPYQIYKQHFIEPKVSSDESNEALLCGEKKIIIKANGIPEIITGPLKRQN